MASLVADYDSDSDSDSTGNGCNVPINVQTKQQTSEGMGHNYLISQDSDSSDSSKEDTKDMKEEKVKEKLPNPLLDNPSNSLLAAQITEPKEGSVFSNRFETAALAKQSILEKHVKMTEAQILTGKKAKICKKFKQGRCFYGKNCQYSHDLDSNLSLRYKPDEQVDVGENSESGHVKTKFQRHNNRFAPQLPAPPVQGFMGTRNTLGISSQPLYSHRQQQHFRQQSMMVTNEWRDEEDDDRSQTGEKRKKKVGLSQTLVPPKRAMSSLSKQRKEERPWTVKK
ncbi:uncharacterized protein LOC127855603 isoform X1 [Dreissena polymorpha]|nr:uncharacterized protein LOC127855603 isoform X1 [Dreissena polymorpha]